MKQLWFVVIQVPGVGSPENEDEGGSGLLCGKRIRTQ